MKPLTWLAFYTPSHSFLHRLPPGIKVFLLVYYGAILFTRHQPEAILLLCTGILLLARLTQLKLPNQMILFTVMILLGIVMLTNLSYDSGGWILIAVAKLVCATALLSLFNMTTKITDIFYYLTPVSSSSIPTVFHNLFYLTQITLAAFPSIEYDLCRAIDAESIRRGRAVRFYTLTAWVTILLFLLRRSLTRGRRWAEVVTERGYSPVRGLKPMTNYAMQWLDIVLTVVVVAPGLLLLGWLK